MNQNAVGKRSKPGSGKQVQIICACPDAEGQGYEDIDVCLETTGEDFAITHYPLVVKCDPELSRQQIVQMLLWLASRLDSNLP